MYQAILVKEGDTIEVKDKSKELTNDSWVNGK